MTDSESSAQNRSAEESFRKQLERDNIMYQTLEFLVVNGLAKPVYEVKRTIERPAPKGDDTISRLEVLATPPESKESLNLVGVFLPLGLGEQDDWLFVTPKGIIIRYQPPNQKEETPLYSYFLLNFYNNPAIKIDDLEKVLPYLESQCWFTKTIYHTDQPSANPQALEARIKEDLETAHRVALERQQRIEAQKIAGQTTFLKTFGNFPPQAKQPE